MSSMKLFGLFNKHSTPSAFDKIQGYDDLKQIVSRALDAELLRQTNGYSLGIFMYGSSDTLSIDTVSFSFCYKYYSIKSSRDVNYRLGSDLSYSPLLPAFYILSYSDRLRP